MKRLMILVGVVAAFSGCAKSPTLPENYAQVGGNWTGNVSSSNYSLLAVNVQMTQSAGTVTGTWVGPNDDWNGSITGSTDKTSFTGTFTISAANAAGFGPRCNVGGPLLQLHWVTTYPSLADFEKAGKQIEADQGFQAMLTEGRQQGLFVGASIVDSLYETIS